MGFGMILMGMLYFATYSAVMKECDAPKSNKTEAGAELTKKHTNHHILSFLSALSCHVVHPPTCIVLLPSIGLLILVPIAMLLLLLLILPLTIVIELP